MAQWTGIILAAGVGRRLNLAAGDFKVMQPIAHLPMLGHVLLSLQQAKPSCLLLVLSPDSQAVADFAKGIDPTIEIIIQDKARGTGDAVRCALTQTKKPIAGKVLVAYGDTPLVEAGTYRKLANSKQDLTFAAFKACKGTRKGYGRFVMEGNKVLAIQEDEGSRALETRMMQTASVRADGAHSGGSSGDGLFNAGLMSFEVRKVKKIIENLKNNNPKREFYLTDLAVASANASASAGVLICAETESQGANTLAELAALEKIYQARVAEKMMASGVVITDPSSVFFAWDTKIGKGTRLAPYITFGVGVKIGTGVEIKSFCHLEGAFVQNDCVIGPYARLRPGTNLAPKVHIGNFVEVKNTKIGRGSKANHLTYLGDATIGAGANIGAGTITCNYDGKAKHQTRIDDGAFIGSNTALVAPVRINKGAYVGSGSVITQDVPPQTLALARARQENIKKTK